MYFGFSSIGIFFDRINSLLFSRGPRFLGCDKDKAEDRSRLVDTRRRRTFSYNLKNDVQSQNHISEKNWFTGIAFSELSRSILHWRDPSLRTFTTVQNRTYQSRSSQTQLVSRPKYNSGFEIKIMNLWLFQPTMRWKRLWRNHKLCSHVATWLAEQIKNESIFVY